MSEWTVKIPGSEHKLSTEELKLWAESGKVKGDTVVVDQKGEHWTAKQIPGVFSKRDWLIALLLSIFVGTLGVDSFYLGKIGTGILKLITIGGFGIWSIIDLILIAIKKLDDKEGLKLA
ncbi:MAG: TM2 domain-containing protein [Aquiluna sp.]